MRKPAVQKSLYPLEQMPFVEWLAYIKKEAFKSEQEAIERLNKKMNRHKINKAVQNRKAKQIGTRRILLSVRNIISN